MTALVLLLSVLIGIPSGNAFLEPLQKRDSILIADQLRYGVQLKDIKEGTRIAFPDFSPEEGSPLEILSSWQLDSVRVSKKKEVPARYDIKAYVIFTTFMGGEYELPDIPVLVGKDTLVFSGPEAITVTELPIDMESFQPNDIKPQAKVPYTLKELFPWIYGSAMILMAIAILVLWFIHRERKSREEALLAAEPAHIRALRKLDKFRGEKFWKPEQQKASYSGVTDTLREYISARYEFGAMEMTTAEIFDSLKGSDVPEELYKEMKELFERADFVKFAKYTASEQENATVLPRAVHFVSETYQKELEEDVL